MSSQANEPLGHATKETNRGLARKLGKVAVAIFVLSLFAGLAAGSIAMLHLRAQAEPQEQITPPVRVSTARAKLVDSYLRTANYTGRLEPFRETNIAFERAGLITSVIANEGDRVASGDVIAQLDTSQLVVSRQRLQARQKELDAQRKLASATLRRQSKLEKRRLSPKQKLDEATATLARLSAGIDQVKAQIAAIDIDLRKSELKAPFDGHIAARFMDEGAVVAAGTAVLQLQEAGHQQARIGLPPKVAADLREGETYTLFAGDTKLQAKLASKRRDLQTGTRTMTVLFDVVEDGNQVSFGDLVTLEFQIRVIEQGAWMPLTALREGRRGMWTVLTVDRSGSDPVIRPESVEVLYARDEMVFVRGTFKDGVETLTNGTDRVVAGQRVALVRE